MRTTRPCSPSPCLLWTFCVAAVTIAPATIAPTALHAQSGPSLEGRRIRLGAPGHELDGREALLDEVREDAFLVRPVGGVEPVRIERLQVQRLEVWEGRHGNALRGMAIGGGTGIVAGLVIGVSAEDTGFLSSGELARIGALFFGVVGAAGGLMVGALVKTDCWTDVDPSAASFVVQPTFTGSGPGIRLRIPLGAG